ncbi:MAG: hypothetical protein HZB50_00790 [Chloroflexi bacterium]|nr:hypothetical protein [Chloroflexota bacterium]
MRTPARPFLFLVFTVLVVSLACSTLSGGNTPAPQLPLPTEEPTDTLVIPSAAPTEPPVQQATNPPEQPTSAPVDVPQDFFKEEFSTNTNLGNWTYFLKGAGKDDAKYTVEKQDDGLLFDLQTANLYVYYLYEVQLAYRDTTVTLVAENQEADNNSNVSLICRLNYDKGQWYEFDFKGNGLWNLWAWDNFKNKKMTDGGSDDLHRGMAVNEYMMTCQGNTITVYVNGNKLTTYTDKTNFFGEGQVGFNIASLNVLPITVNVKSFEIAEP